MYTALQRIALTQAIGFELFKNPALLLPTPVADKFFDVVLFIGDVGEPVLGSLLWSAVVTDRSHLFVITLYFGLSVATRA